MSSPESEGLTSELENGEMTILNKANNEALAFLSSLESDPSVTRNLAFQDLLLTSSQTGKEIGEMKITVEDTAWRGQKCFLIHANSHGVIDQLPCGTSITAYVSRSLQTLEQTQHEYIQIPENFLDKKTLLIMEENEYIVKKTVSQGEDIKRTEYNYPLTDFEGFISEGSNILLQRIFAQRGLPDNLQFLSFDTETCLCPVSYTALDKIEHSVGSQEISAGGFQRTISSHDESISWNTYFLPDGHMVSRTQVGSHVKMRLAEVPSPIKLPETQGKPKPKDLKWEEDMELYSKFMDRKEELADDHSTYVRSHPELKALLADFLQFLLLRKPDDVCTYASEYFGAFSSSSSSSTPAPHIPKTPPAVSSSQTLQTANAEQQ